MVATMVQRPGSGFVHPDRAKNFPGAVPRPAVWHPKQGNQGNNANQSINISMDQIIDGANKVLQYIENNGQEDPVITGYIRTVKDYALNARKGDSTAQGGMTKVIAALEKIAADTERLNNRMDTLEKSSTNSSTSASSLSSADRWRSFRAGAWQREAAINAVPPTHRSDGTASPGVPEIELREDRTIVVKVDPSCREKIRQTDSATMVQKAELLREKQARKKTSAALAGGAYFVAARVLPSGDVAMLVDSASGAELLRRHTDWVSFFGREAKVQKPSWGVVVHGLPVKTFKLTPDSRAGLAAEMQRQNSMSWGGKAEILNLDWLTRPRDTQREASVVIEFDHPVVANQAIDAGLIWKHEIHTVVFFCRDGRVKLCRKCQKTGHIQSHCPSKEFVCGHCARQHPTWECESERGVPVTTKCANCGGAHRPTSPACQVKQAARKIADQMRAQCPPYHRIPLHFRSHAPLAPAQEPARGPMPRRNPIPATKGTLDASIHAPTPVALVSTAPTSSAPIRRGPGRPKGSKNKSKESTVREDDDLPTQQEATKAALAVSRRSRTTRSQQEMVRLMTDPERILHTNNKRRRMVEPENVMEEDPDTDTDIWATQPQPQQQEQPQRQKERTISSETGHLLRQFGANLPPREKVVKLRIKPPMPQAPTPTEDTQVPSHGLDLGIEIPSFLAFGSSPPQTAPEEVATATNPIEIVDDEQFFEVSDGSDRSDHDDQDDQDNTDNDLYNE
jgi:hypothetical protein